MKISMTHPNKSEPLPGPEDALQRLLEEARACRVCEASLPLGPRPVLRAKASARILIAGQAPGLRVHQTGVPWNDPSGDRLRAWMGIGREAFYDDSRIAIIPSGFCYPGRDPRGGDLPPRAECAETWLAPLMRLLPHIQFAVLAGAYAQRLHLGGRIQSTLTETVRSWREYAPRYLPLPHPSFRNNQWLKRNPWFETEVLPYLRKRVRLLLR